MVECFGFVEVKMLDDFDVGLVVFIVFGMGKVVWGMFE